MSSIIIFNKNNVALNGNNNVLEYDFNNTSLNFKNMEIALGSIQMYNSQYNISSSFNNTTFQIQVPTGSTYQTVSINLPDGYYKYTDISNYISTQLVSIGAYLIDSAGNQITYLRITDNPTYYSCQIDLLATPTTLPSGYTRPSTGLYSSGGSGLPTASNTPKIVLLNNNFTKTVGFSAGTYPSTTQTTDQSFLSNFTPAAHPVSSYLIRCNIVDNKVSNPPDILTTFSTQGSTIGEMIDVKPNELSWIRINDGIYNNITLTIIDQEYRDAILKDPDILITILLRERKA